jgi:hypothetical protein
MKAVNHVIVKFFEAQPKKTVWCRSPGTSGDDRLRTCVIVNGFNEVRLLGFDPILY